MPIQPPVLPQLDYGRAIGQGTQNALAQAQLMNVGQQMQQRNALAPGQLQQQQLTTDAAKTDYMIKQLSIANPQNYQGIRQDLISKGMPESNIPADYNEQYINQVVGRKPAADTGFTLSPGQQRFSAEGKPIASVAAKPEKPGPGEDPFSREGKLRDKYQNQTKDYVKVRDAYGRIKASAKDPSAAGDLALIFNYMKVLDPGSTVREGEFATAQNATGVPQQIVNMYNKVMSGQRLAPEQRSDFVGRSEKLYEAQEKGLAQLENQYKALAKRYKLNPENIITDYRVDYDMPAGATPEDQQAIQWAKQNPDDPRSRQILQIHGAR